MSVNYIFKKNLNKLCNYKCIYPSGKVFFRDTGDNSDLARFGFNQSI